MSVLNQCGEDLVECPLCMEPFEVDDFNFYPCTCGYQICRFCWHRIRTDENGLCPACRKAYSEDPADFIPLSQEEMAKLKAAKRLKDQQRKAKLSENRKHLASVRVVQRNLVFVVGLPLRLADPEVLKKHEYFGKFGKIHKVVINQSTSYAGSQGPSASAYVTYMKSDDALRAIQSVNNITIDGRLIKSSLGTTKYCSHFMKNQPCPKPDCMYLHDFGDPEASFTKEQMHAGKHQEYEKKLHEVLQQRCNNQQNNQNQAQENKVNCSNNSNTTTTTTTSATTAAAITATAATVTTSSNSNNSDNNSKLKENQQQQQNGTNKENWPQLDKFDNNIKDNNNKKLEKIDNKLLLNKNNNKKKILSKHEKIDENHKIDNIPKLKEIIDDNSSFFSHNTFHKLNSTLIDTTTTTTTDNDTTTTTTELTDNLPITTNEDWAAAFGFTTTTAGKTTITNDDTTRTATTTSTTTDFYENNIKLHENLIDVLSNNKTNFIGYNNNNNNNNSLEQNMSKFFLDFHRNGFGQQSQQQQQQQQQQNGYYLNNERLLFLQQQKKIEEQLLNFGLKQNNYNNSNNYFNNGDNSNFLLQQRQQQQQHNNITTTTNSNNKIKVNLDSDELDFDPFQETQKAFAELMANEQNHKHHSTVRNAQLQQQSPINGIIHNNHSHSNGLPPPPPGFVQPTNHMNSFGSKILPFLNMTNNSQINNTLAQQQQQQHNNWSSTNFLPQHQKNIGNDWKDFDSAIVTTSRHYPLNMPPPIRDHFIQQQQQQQQQQNGIRNNYVNNDYNTFSTFAQQLHNQQNYNNLPATTTTTSNLNWFNNIDLNGSVGNNTTTGLTGMQSTGVKATTATTQISSPPGFRTTNQTTKQQEC